MFFLYALMCTGALFARDVINLNHVSMKNRYLKSGKVNVFIYVLKE